MKCQIEVKVKTLLLMGMGNLSCLLVLLISLVNVDARYKDEPVPMNEGDKFPFVDNLPPESICESCLEPSKKAEETSRDPKLFEILGMVSTEVCHILPSDVKAKCLETSDAYVHRSRLLVDGIFNEETLCNRTGLCLWKSMFSVINGLASVTDEEEITDENTCTACRRSVRDIFVQLNRPKMRMRVMESLIEYCEEVEDNEQYCKQKVYKYAPLLLSKLEKLKTSDFCRMMGFCDEGML